MTSDNSDECAMMSGNSEECVMTSGSSRECVMTSGKSGECVKMSGNSRECAMMSGTHWTVGFYTDRVCILLSVDESYDHCAKHNQGASTYIFICLNRVDGLTFCSEIKVYYCSNWGCSLRPLFIVAICHLRNNLFKSFCFTFSKGILVRFFIRPLGMECIV